MVRRIVLASVLAVSLLAGGLLFGDDQTSPPARGSLPPNWSKLGLTDEQKQKVYSIQTDYRGKINALQQQIKQLRQQEGQELAKVLTDTQKARLKEILASKVPGESSKDEKKPAEKK